MWPPESPTMAEMSFVPMPVVVMMQAMIPATAQAAPTVSVLFAVSSRASKNLVKFILVSFLKRLTITARTVPIMAARAIVVFIIRITNAIRGNRRYPFFMSTLKKLGSSFLGRPLSPVFLPEFLGILELLKTRIPSRITSRIPGQKQQY